jgi:hypothetical protein
VHEREQPLHGPGVAASPFDQEGGHVVGPDVRQGPPILRPSEHDSCCRWFTPFSPTGGPGLPGGTP